MIREIYINNFALIDDLSLKLSKGFSVITGETGSGKSILLEALSLALGERADLSVVRDPEKKCVVELHIDISTYGLKSFFSESDLDYDDLTIVRREIVPGGKSRAFINDTPVVLTDLKTLSSRLVRISSQHETLSLKDVDFQLKFLDAFVENQQLIGQVKDLYNQWKSALSALKEQEDMLNRLQSDREYYEFQLRELIDAQLDRDDLTSLEEELSVAEKSDTISQGVGTVLGYIDGEGGVLDQIAKIDAELRMLVRQDNRLDDYYNRLSVCREELKDLALSFSDYLSSVDTSPERLSYLNERVNLINGLLMKHKKISQAELLEYRNEIENRLTDAGNVQDHLDSLRKNIDALREEYDAKASMLSKEREKSAIFIEKEVSELLIHLGMKEAEIRFGIKPLAEPTSQGSDDIELFFKANEGLGFQSLSRTASGGELSRLMLSIQALYSEKKSLSTLIFDEIDTGVSGEVAAKVAGLMRRMSERMQIIAITHLPQVAAKGKHHFVVSKLTREGHTYSEIRNINNEERVEHLAQMISGSKVTEAANQHARSLLQEEE